MNKYSLDKTKLGQLLFSLGEILDKDPFANHQFTKEFFYELAEKVVLDHRPILKQINSINSLKVITKKELYRKVLKGKDYIDSNYLSKIEINTIAKESNLSEYHFFRLFKSVFKISPLQYIISKRLEIAKQLLQNKALKLADIAVITGFSDMQSLSKAFKKQYGTSPSKSILE
ncbi:MAG: helix-turn-helix transcriptional regulator [Sphingobacteriaceae bacterium]|nr:helix-turn-helix transcriptional regulator [Sphingobacteriaceae bacterium]